jgi:hypothetical protein
VTAAPSLRQGNWFIIGINGQDQMTVAILLLFESLKKFQRLKLCDVIRRNKVSFKTKIMRIHQHPSTRNGKKETGYYKTSGSYLILVVPEPGRVMPVSNNQKKAFVIAAGFHSAFFSVSNSPSSSHFLIF